MTDRPSSMPVPVELSAPPRVSLAPLLTSGRAIGVVLVVVLLAAALFALAPQLDLGTAALFYTGGNSFVGQAAWGLALRRVFYWVPFGLFLVMVALFLARRFGGRVRIWAPSWRGITFLAVSLAVGPGLLVNTTLKDHSHRPRPIQVTEFGGSLPFRPFYSFDGGCRRNCSFVSGEGSAGFWTVAPALLMPASLQPLALAAALAFGVAASLLRMALGGHFLSDTVFAALFTWLVVVTTWRALCRPDVVSKTGPKPIINHDGRTSRPG